MEDTEWTRVVGADGEASYVHRETGEVSWEVPTAEDEWDEIVDVYGSGQTYYVNRRTGESRWEVPTQPEWVALDDSTYVNQYTLAMTTEHPATASAPTVLTPEVVAELPAPHAAKIQSFLQRPKSVYKIGPPPSSLLHIMSASPSFFATMDADMQSPTHYDELRKTGSFSLDTLDAVAVMETTGDESSQEMSLGDDDDDEILQHSRMLDEARTSTLVVAAPQESSVAQLETAALSSLSARSNPSTQLDEASPAAPEDSAISAETDEPEPAVQAMTPQTASLQSPSEPPSQNTIDVGAQEALPNIDSTTATPESLPSNGNEPASKATVEDTAAENPVPELTPPNPMPSARPSSRGRPSSSPKTPTTPKTPTAVRSARQQSPPKTPTSSARRSARDPPKTPTSSRAPTATVAPVIEVATAPVTEVEALYATEVASPTEITLDAAVAQTLSMVTAPAIELATASEQPDEPTSPRVVVEPSPPTELTFEREPTPPATLNFECEATPPFLSTDGSSKASPPRPTTSASHSTARLKPVSAQPSSSPLKLVDDASKAQVLAWQTTYNRASNGYYHDVELIAHRKEMKMLLMQEDRDEREMTKKLVATQLQTAAYTTYEVISRQLTGYDLKKHINDMLTVPGKYEAERNAARALKYASLQGNATYWKRVAATKCLRRPQGTPAAIQDRLLTDRNEIGDTLLHAAAAKGYVAKAKHLISLGANVNLVDNSVSRATPLHEAAMSGSANMVKLLLSAGADLSAADATGDLPLHVACRSGFTTVVKVLLHADIDLHTLDVRNYKCRTPVQVVKKASLRVFLQGTSLLQRH
ncbi:hypothetical protein ACHHYP_03141 [Achlya hypogyna]|uniref:WW domain-containing protein n=1 Tax=Achlya hypogyna TaxID=1202772 RepID=A0A1V9Z4C9_ACHHY|nr:hypothetical protein ACHHYP_03141 [Achlya hypogyna]